MFKRQREVIRLEPRPPPLEPHTNSDNSVSEASSDQSRSLEAIENVFLHNSSSDYYHSSSDETSQSQEEEEDILENSPQDGNQVEDSAASETLAVFEQQVSNIEKWGQTFSCNICRYCFTSQDELDSHKVHFSAHNVFSFGIDNSRTHSILIFNF